MSPCISRSKREQMANEAEKTIAQYNTRPLTEYERERADEFLVAQGWRDSWLNDEVRMQVLVKMGLRK